MLQDNRSGAIFGPDREYRYRLHRTWNTEKLTVAFIMLNPSTADETANDPTVRRCIGYAKDWGYGTLLVGNIFALRSTDPKQLYEHTAPVGPDNDDHLQSINETAERTIAAWGTYGSLRDRGIAVTKMLEGLQALNVTKHGHPNHPLYQPRNAEIQPYTVEAAR